MSNSEKTSIAAQEAKIDGSQPDPAGRKTEKELRDTAAGCRERASSDLVKALATSTLNGRQVLETSAASWTKRGEMLERIEAGIARRQEKDSPEPVELTQSEIAEDLAHQSLEGGRRTGPEPTQS